MQASSFYLDYCQLSFDLVGQKVPLLNWDSENPLVFQTVIFLFWYLLTYFPTLLPPYIWFTWINCLINSLVFISKRFLPSLDVYNIFNILSRPQTKNQQFQTYRLVFGTWAFFMFVICFLPKELKADTQKMVSAMPTTWWNCV
jgi:hypothetical protein